MHSKMTFFWGYPSAKSASLSSHVETLRPLAHGKLLVPLVVTSLVAPEGKAATDRPGRKDGKSDTESNLVGGFNPFEKY